MQQFVRHNISCLEADKIICDMEMRYMSLGSNIGYLRKQKKYTQEQFAEKMSVTRQNVSRWESDEVVPELAKLIEICCNLCIPGRL